MRSEEEILKAIEAFRDSQAVTFINKGTAGLNEPPGSVLSMQIKLLKWVLSMPEGDVIQEAVCEWNQQGLPKEQRERIEEMKTFLRQFDV